MKYLLLCFATFTLATSCKKKKDYCWKCINHTYNTRNGKAIVDVKDSTTVCGITEDNIDGFEKSQSSYESRTEDPGVTYERTHTTTCEKQ